MRGRIIVFMVLSLFLFSSAYAANLGISKASLEIMGDVDEKICSDLNLFSGDLIQVSGSDLWNLKNSRDLNDYTLNSRDLELVVEYPDEISVNKKEPITLCISGKYDGEYYGVLMYKSSDKIGVGTWLDVTIGNGVNPSFMNPNKNIVYSSNISLTGSSVNNLNKISFNSLAIAFLFFTVLLIIVIAVLVFMLIKRRRDKVV